MWDDIPHVCLVSVDRKIHEDSLLDKILKELQDIKEILNERRDGTKKA
jgi:hypothetical protein